MTSPSASYNLESLALPKLAGNSLRLVAAALGFGPTRALLLGKLLRDGGISKIRNWRLDEAPTLYPSPLASGDEPADEATSEFATGRVTPFCDAAAIAAAFRAGDLTPSDIAKRYLAALEESRGETPSIGAMISVIADDVLEQARAADERFAKGAPLGPLDGVPVAIKDEVDQRGHPTTVGTAFLGDEPAIRDATIVARLRAAGAVLIGKTNMHEIGINPTGLNVHHGISRNPYDRSRDPGGSSSGSAVTVAAGLAPIAIGADGGGSIRIPAALCGLVGLKATFGRISEDGAAPLTWSMGHLGPIGASVADCAAAYQIIAGVDERDPRTALQPPPTLGDWQSESLSGVRLGIFAPWFDHAEDEVVQKNRAMLESLVARGAVLVDIAIPELDEMRIAHAVTILVEMATAMENHRDHLKKLGAGVRINLTVGRTLRASDYVVAQRMRTRAVDIFAKAFRKVDAIITPATAIVAPPFPKKALPHGYSDLNAVTEVMRYVIPGNFVGLPAISFPVGYSKSGLPIAMQAMSNHWDEALLFRIAHAAETELKRVAPPGYIDLLSSV